MQLSREIIIVGLLTALLTRKDGLRKGRGSRWIDVAVGSLICTIAIEGSSSLITLSLILATEVQVKSVGIHGVRSDYQMTGSRSGSVQHGGER